MSETPPKQVSRPRSVSPLLPPSSQTGQTSFNQNTHDLSPSELTEECRRLRDENRQLQLRILGVNELARLLQERSDAVKLLEEKNKRLEVAVVRLENRYANLERKVQKGGVVPGVKQGMSPFIPGPSKQILEGLMKENSELKKTLNNMQKRGGSGYLEAVKSNQLEEVIDNQKQEIEFLKEQVNKLTSTGLPEGQEETSRGGLLSLPSGVSDSGPLKRQLIKMEHAMKVKDRFCSLLSQQVSELQKRLALAKLDLIDGTSQSTSTDVVNETQQTSGDTDISATPPSGGGSYEELFKQEKEQLQKERNDRRALVEKMGATEKELKIKKAEIDRLNQDIDSMETYQSTLISEKTELSQQLREAQRELDSLRDGGSEDSGRGTSGSGRGPVSSGGGRVQELEKRNGELEKVLESTIEHYTAELTKKDKEMDVLQTQLEESNFNRAVADSKLQQEENLRKQKVNEMQEKMTDLEDDLEAQKSHYSDLLMRNRELEITFQKLRAAGSGRSMQSSSQGYGFLQTGGAPHLIVGGEHNRAMAMVKDSAGSQSGAMQQKIPSVPVLARGVDPPQQTTPPQVHKPPPTQLPLGGQQLSSRSTQLGRPLSPASHLQYYKQQQQQQQQAAAQNQQSLQTPATPVAHFQGSQSMMGGRPYSPTRNAQQYGVPQHTYSGHTPSSSIGMGMARTLSGNQPTVSSIGGSAYGRSHTMPLATLSTTPTTGSILRGPSYSHYTNTGVMGGYYDLSNQGHPPQQGPMSTASALYYQQQAMSGASGQPVSGTGFTGSGGSGMRQMSNDSAYDSGSLPSRPMPPSSSSSGGTGGVYDNRSTSPYDPHYGGSSGYPH